MIDLQIRTAVPDDAEAVLAFWREAAEGTSITDDADGVTRLIGRDPQALILAESGGTLVGTVIAGYDGWRCSLTGSRCCPRTVGRGSRRRCSKRPNGASWPCGAGAGTPWSWNRTSTPSERGRPPATGARTTGDAG